jgi:peroxiredoxin
MGPAPWGKRGRWGLHTFLLISGLFCLTGCRGAATEEPLGVWQGTVTNPSGEEVVFTLEVTREGDQLNGSFLNGEDRTRSTGATWDGETLTLLFDYYDGRLTARVTNGRLEGEYTRQWQRQQLRRVFRGARLSSAEPPRAVTQGAGPLSGEWILAVGDPPARRYWRATFRQDHDRVDGTFIPVSGDWGQLTGRFDGTQLTLNRFDGINSRLFQATLRSDGRLEGRLDLGLFDPQRPVIAERLDQTNQEMVAALPDPDTYTHLRNPEEPFRFAFPDLDGTLVSSTDERFRGKVVLLSITGSWCPNCHEESPLLQTYYDRYRDRGLDVIALAFEYTGDPARDLEQLRIFARRHQLTYPVLLAGTTEEGEIGRKLPQLVNFGAYPTTIFVGRDGTVKRIHTGFEGRATGERYIRLKAEYESFIQQLLAEPAPPIG